MFYWLEKLSRRQIYMSAIILSLLLSVLSYILFPNVGNDGVLYLRCAAAYEESGLKAAMALYHWPFYSITIAYIHQMGLSWVNAGHVLDAFLQAWMVYFFIRLIFHFEPKSHRVGFWALCCILCYSTFNSDRSLLLRDFGYWAFYLNALWNLLRYLKTEKLHYLSLFGLCILIAMLFRIEGVIIAVTAIVLVFFMPAQSFFMRIRNSFVMAWPFWLGALLFVVMGSHRLYDGGRLQEIYYNISHLIHVLSQNKIQTIQLMDKALYVPYPFIPTSKMYFSMLTGYFLYKIVLTTGIGYTAFAVYAWLKKALYLSSREKVLLYGLMIVQVLMLGIFLVNHLFLTVRYVLALSLLILLWMPFGLEHIYQKIMALPSRKYHLGMAVVLITFFIFNLLYGFVHIGPSKQYLNEGTSWLKQHVAAKDRIAVNDNMMLYNVKGPISTWSEDFRVFANPSDCQFSAYRYVVIKLRKKTNPLEKCTDLHLVQSYHNARGDRVNIYEVNNL